MLGLKVLFAKQRGGHQSAAIEAWARRHGYGFKHEREGAGFVIDGTLDGKPWRLEWGPPQRDYIAGHELRLRMELGLPPSLQMMIAARPLLQTLEKRLYEQATDGNQTVIGDTTPEEMRWLMMFPKMDLSTLRVLRTNFGGVASHPDEGRAWLEGPLAHQLEQAVASWLLPQTPFLLMTLRGRCYLRMEQATPDERDVPLAVALFETAAREAMRVGGDRGDVPVTWENTTSTAWGALGSGKRSDR